MTAETRTLGATFILLIVASCANPGIVQLSPDTYMLSRVDRGGVFGNAAAMKASVINDANAFAKSKGKIAIPISTREMPMVVAHNLASFEYQLKLVDPDSQDARPTPLTPRPDVVIEQNERKTVDVHTMNKSDAKQDLYTDLMKLDDLRKRGVITQAEFEALKAKLIEAK